MSAEFGLQPAPLTDLILDSVDEAFILVDSCGVIQYLNRAAQTLLAPIPCSPVGSPALDVLRSDLQASFRAALLNRSTAELSIPFHAQPMPNGRTLVRFVPASGPTAIRRLEAASERLRLPEDSRLGVFDWDLRTGHAVIAPAFERLCGFEPGTFAGSVDQWLARIHPADRDGVVKLLSAAIENRTAHFILEYRILLPDGSLRWMQSRASLILDSDSLPERLIGIASDITEKKLTEQALSDAQTRLDLALRAGGFGFYEWNLASGTVSLSPECLAFAGVSPAEFDGKWETWLGRLHREDAEMYSSRLERAFHLRKTEVEIDLRMQAREGRLVWVTNRAVIRYGEAGTPSSVSGVLIDISSRKRVEETLRFSEERFRTLCESGPVAVFYGVDNECRYISPAWERLSGRSAAESLGTGWVQAIHPEDRERLFHEWQDSMIRTLEWSGEFRLLRPDGSICWVVGTSSPIVDTGGAVLGYIGRILDRTKEKETERQLAVARERVAFAQKSARIGVAESDLATGRLVWCDQMEALFGLAPGTFEGTREAWARRVHPEDLPRIQREWELTVKARKPRCATDYRVILPDGRIRWLYATSSCYYGAGGELTRALSVHLDITDRKRAEEKRQAAIAELRVANERLAIAQTASGSGLWESNPPAGILYWSDQCYELFGLPKSVTPSTDVWLACVVPEDRAGALEAMERAAREDGDIQTEYRILRHGVVRWIRRYGRPYRDNAGQVVRVAGIDIDVTASKEAESQLRQSELHLRALAEAVPAILFAADAAGRNEYCGKYFEEYTGLSQGAAAGEGWLSAFHPDDIPGWRAAFARASESQAAFTAEFRLRRWDGVYRRFRSQAAPATDSHGAVERWVGICVDIQDQPKHLLETLLEATSDHLYLLDRDKRYIYASPKGLAALGKSTDELLGKTWREAGLPAGVMEPFERELDAVLETGESRRGELTWPFETDSRSFEHVLNPVFGVSGAIEAVAIKARDITGRKTAESALRESEERVRVAKDASRLGIYDYDLVTGRLNWDDRLRELWGLSPGDPVDYEVFLAGLHPEDRARTNLAVERSFDPAGDGGYRAEYRVISRADQSIRWILATGRTTFSENRAVRLIGTVQDISELKAAEQALRESEERFRNLADNIAPLAWMADPDGSISWYNQRWYHYTGTVLEEMQGWGWQKVVHPDHLGRVLARIRHSFQTGEPWEDTFPLLGEKGGYCWFLSRALPIRDDSGRVVRWFGTHTDITEHLEIQESLRKSEQRYRALFESMQEGFAVGDVIRDDEGRPVDWRYLDVNPAFESLLGVERRNVIGHTYRELFPDGRWDYWGPRVAETALTGKPARLEMFDSGRHWEAVVYSPAAGQFALIFSDVTEARQAQEDLRASEERLRLAARAARFGTYDADLESGAVYLSPETLSILGLPETAPSFSPWTVPYFVHPDDRAVVAESVRQAAAGDGMLFLEHRILEPDGSLRWLQVRGQIQFATDEDGSRRAIRSRGMILDVTDRKEAEDARSLAVRRLEAQIDNSPLATVEFDPDFRITRWSKEAERMFGWTAGEVIARTVSDLHWVHEDDAPAVRQLCRELVDGARPKVAFTNRNYRKDGAVILCDWYSSATYGSDGKIVSIFAQVLDVTEKRRTEERLRDAQKMESIGLLAGGVAHDFNNLLVGVIGNASLAMEMVPQNKPLQDLLAQILKSGDQAAHLTRQLLAYSGKGQFVLEPVNLSNLVREVTDLARASASKKIEFRMDLSPGLPIIEADRSQVHQILMNLVLNATEAIGEANGLIEVRTGVETSTEGSEPGNFVFLEVRDTGCGMDEATAARVFDPFFTTKFLGRGLGLAAVAGIVRAHKGAIRVTSAPGRGATFRVLFPSAPPRPAAPPRKPADSLAVPGAVLVVDDEELVRSMARLALGRRGCEVVTAASGAEALEILQQDPAAISFVILDLSMPGMSGQEVLPRLLAIKPELDVVISSGYTELDALKLFRGMPVAGFLQKPYTAQRIAEKIQSVLRAKAR